ncbi:unnamed protein product [Bursaphelenchus okinawaensis]|uniref:Poly [ADP-ribose] polymerase n=1 Tax=Bursaphelenchus okinawaensis TaxID=465554 RepID=A0A811LP85_9BILA|nr:unnamed protein product [Bursaphelenchus okinawaensis]CAG9127505.1 unnamed protein product [Bursaphelenchus okinawaensis]
MPLFLISRLGNDSCPFNFSVWLTNSRQRFEPTMATLTNDVRRLMENIGDMDKIKRELLAMNFDVNEYPVHCLTKDFIMKGYQHLTQVEQYVLRGDIRSLAFQSTLHDYFRTIPRLPPPDTRFIDRAFIEREAGQLLSKSQCEIELLDRNSRVHQILENYLLNSQGDHGFSLKLRNIFRVNKKEGYNPYMGNEMVLWHGSKTTSYSAILQCSLNKAPPEAPMSGHMFGKGIYFSDCSTKAAQYCHVPRGGTGYLMLCLVALGKSKNLIKGDYSATQLQNEYHSVTGMGKHTFASYDAQLCYGERDLLVPTGKLVRRPSPDQYTLQYNEYVVYDQSQVRMAFLLEVEFY